jgi:hypothetical protein
MSALLAVVTAVTATPLPSAAPEVIKTVVTQVPVTPQSVIDLFQLLALAVAGGLTSLIHLALERGRLSANLNRLIVTLYSTAAAVAVMALTGKLGLAPADLATGLTALLAFAGSNQGQHMLSGFIGDVLESKTTTDPSGAQVLSSDAVAATEAAA